MLPRGTLWRLEITTPVAALLIEATNDSYRLPDKGVVGEHAIFDPAALDMPRLDEIPNGRGVLLLESRFHGWKKHLGAT
jgi:homogentisate 1,2-dioxygenase